MTRIGSVAGRLLLGVVALVVLAPRIAWGAPMFPDVPDMWAADAVRQLAQKGMLEGYPDGTFKGDRAATRYEVAMIVARLLAREEQEHALFASKADLDELRRLVNSLRDELDALGVRVTNLESQVSTLDRRVTELERVTFYGNLRTIGVTQNIAGANFIGTTANPGVDFSNGRLLFSGIGATARFLLGVHAKLNPEMDAGLEVVAYSATGSSAVEQYWGVTPPYQSNPFVAQATFPAANGVTTGTGLMQPDNHQPFTRMTLDRFWLHDKARDYSLVFGTWQATNIGDQVLLGIRNPNVNAPGVLPFFGAQVTNLDPKDPFQYEFGYSELPTGSLYRGWLGTASSYFKWDRGSFGVSLLKLGQESYTDGQALPGGLVQLPTANGQQLQWRDSRTGLLTSVVGPQNQFTWGANLNFDLLPRWLALRANYGGTRYNPDTSSTFLSTRVNGSMYDVGLVGHIGQFRPEVEYLHVDPTYDTIMLNYAVNPGIPVFLPYGNWYSSNYQLHDYLKYPTNREGFRATLNWENQDSAAFGTVESFTQTKATTFAQITTPGNAEALFPIILTPGDASRGTTLTTGLGFTHLFGRKLRFSTSWFDYTLRRGGASIDSVNFTQNFYRAAISYAFTDQIDASLNYAFLDFSGHTGLLNRTFEQSIPGVSLNWQAARNTSISLNARLFNYRDRAFGINNWRGNQVGVDVNVDI